LLEFFNPSILFARSLNYWVEMVGVQDNDRSSVIESIAQPVTVSRDNNQASSLIVDDGDDAGSRSVEESVKSNGSDVTEF
jgi:hypothetical protein